MPSNKTFSILDGGLGRELIRRSTHICDKGTWASWFLTNAPQIVKELHTDYIRVGCDIITTNTYSCTPEVAEKMDTPLKFLIQTACKLAKESVQESNADVAVLGSLPPLTSSHRPDLVLKTSELRSQYAQILEYLAPEVDYVVCETMSCVNEAVTAAEVAAQFGTPTWVSVEIRSGATLVSGESYIDLIDELVKMPHITGIFYNCCTIENINEGLPLLKTTANKHNLLWGAWPNKIEVPAADYDNSKKVPEINTTEDEFAAISEEWVSQGMNVIGGCCAMGPSFIRALSERIHGKEYLSEKFGSKS